MFETLKITNFQSLQNVSLRLGRLTLLTGESSCGKTAVLRALKVLATNGRGSRYITAGKKSAAIQLSSEDVQVTFSKNGTQSSYVVTDLKTRHEDTYTKLAGSVPEEVTAALNLSPDTNVKSVNFADQMDPPYLLMSTPSQVAAALGDITGVSELGAAVSEANKTRNSMSSLLKTRAGDLKSTEEELESCSGVQVREEALESVSALVVRAKQLDAAVQGLSLAINASQTAAECLQQAEVPQAPDLTDLESAWSEFSTAKALVAAVVGASRAVSAAEAVLRKAEEAETENGEMLHRILEEAGVCPTCGSEVGSR